MREAASRVVPLKLGSDEDKDESEPGVDTFAIVMSCVIIAVVVVILIGNSLVLVLYCRDRSLRVATNFFISMLCVTDLLVGVSLVCCIALWLDPALFDETTILCVFLYAMTCLFMALSLHFQTVVGCERWLAISRPLRYKSMVTMPRVVLISVMVWIFCISVFFLLPVLWRNEPDFCHFWVVLKEEFVLFVAVPIYFVLCSITVYCYARIFLTARKLTRKLGPVTRTTSSALQRHSQGENDLKAAKTLGAVVILNIITWVPCMVVLIVLAVDDSDPPSETMLNVATVTILLPCLHSVWNPWIYALRLPAFRAAGKRFRDKTCHSCKKHSRQSWQVEQSIATISQ